MATLISMIIWGFASFKIAKMIKENEGLDVKPINSVKFDEFINVYSLKLLSLDWILSLTTGRIPVM